jgi:hypothetical protein
MNTHADKTPDSKSQTVVRNDYSAQSGSESSFQFADNRAETTSQRKLNELANNSQNLKQAAQLQSFAKSYPGQPIQKVGIEEEEPLQGKFIPVQRQGIEEEELLQGKFEPIQKKENKTGLPDNLKSGIEGLSGYSLDDVKVNYNSNKPAQLNAHAYAQGTEIHVASGQEKHLPHEAWHVVQQKQGRVKPTMQMKGHVNVNDDEGLEREADVMGAKALQRKAVNNVFDSEINKTPQSTGTQSMQMVVQRLALNGTNWGNVSTITASAGGVGGVLFMSDAASTLVVKPNVEADEEMIASHLHGSLPQPPRDNMHNSSRWHISSLSRRFATPADVNDIQNLIPGPVKAAATPAAKATTLLGQIAVNATMIQEKGGGNAETYEDMLENHKNALNIIPGANRTGRNRKDKVKDTSPIKPLTKDPSFAIALGQLAATDIFLGNFDRLVWASNIGNLLVDSGAKTVYPIDNVDNNSTVRFTPQPGNPAITLADWRNNKYVRWLVGRSWNLLADEIWEGPLVMNNLLDDIISHTLPAESNLVRNKLTNHLSDIKKNFIEGLKLGRANIVSAGLLPISNAWSVAARNLYNQRLGDL